MQRMPEMVQALAQMTAAVSDPEQGRSRFQAPSGSRRKPRRRMPILHCAHHRRRNAFRSRREEGCGNLGLPD
jgi:hypothetical protein